MRNKLVGKLKNIWKKLNKKYLVIAGVVVTIIMAVVLIVRADLFNRGMTVAEVSKMICYASYDKEYLDSLQIDGYWYDNYIKLCNEKGYFSGKDANDKVTYSDMRTIAKGLGITDKKINSKLWFWGVVSRDKLIDIYINMLPMFPYGSDVKTIDAALAGTPSNISELGEWKAYTSKGIYGFTGLILDDKIDKQVSMIVCKDEILAVVSVTAEEVIYKNIWVKYTTDNKIYTNIYGVDREFDVEGLERHVSKVLSDVKIVKGQVKNVDIKTDTISGKVLSATSQYIEIEGYGKVDLDEDFMIYDISDDFKVSDYQNIILGYSLQDFVVANGMVCGAVINKSLEVDNVRVLIKNTGYKSIFHENVSVTSDKPYEVKVGEVTNGYGAGEVLEISKDSEMFAEGRITVKPADDGEIKILNVNRSQGAPSYKGHIELAVSEDGITIVNDVNVEEYLKRVVPSEMPASFGVEALKVQAVCARSYVYRQLSNKHYSQYGAHVDDSTQYLVYNNTVEYESSNKAIADTNGLVLSHNGNIVQAYYYSTSCGVGSDVGLWGTDVTKYPYFVSRDIGSESRNLDMTDEAVFEKFINNTYDTDYDRDFPLYRWSMSESVDEISKGFNIKLAAQYAQYPERVLTLKDGAYKSQEIDTVGDIKDIMVTKRASGGAVVELVVTGSKATVKISSESVVRNLFGNENVILKTLKDERRWDNLPSAFCMFKKVCEGGKVVGFEIKGGGYGHGIGMSQNAVKTMVKNGMTYDEVLQFFYPGTSFLE
ncbi:MAG: SpoIID/LytB domain-containing protein [Lachnospira sp.]|nr:SpoIID/LytB domain-containing protein [Lachnospira sp.]